MKANWPGKAYLTEKNQLLLFWGLDTKKILSFKQKRLFASDIWCFILLHHGSSKEPRNYLKIASFVDYVYRLATGVARPYPTKHPYITINNDEILKQM